MKPTDFAKHLTEFLSDYLPRQKNVSKNTLYSYRDTFKLLIKYCQLKESITAERITLDILSSKLMKRFLEWLENERQYCISSRNQRLAALHSFFRYVQTEEPSGMFHFQKILALPMKKAQKPVVEHPAVIILNGKGGKIRRVPLMKNTFLLVQSYLWENKLNASWKNEYPLFANNQHRKLTKEGVAYIVAHYVESARRISTIVPPKVKVHMFRHSKAMHLLQAGVNLIYIR